MPMNAVIHTEQAQGEMTSRLLEKARRLGLELPLDLERLAVIRGCDYYERELPPRVPALGDVPLSNAELAIALLVPSLRPAAREIRLAAALLGAPDVRADQVAALAVQEHCTAVVHHIARAGQRFEPNNAFWPSLLERLPDVKVHSDGLPHPTRFVEMTGIDRGKIEVSTRWIRPRKPALA